MGQEKHPFEWECQPKAELLLIGFLEDCCNANESVAELKEGLERWTSSRLFDWIDHFVVGYSEEIERALCGSGFESEAAASQYRVFHHPAAQLPRVVMKDDAPELCGVAVSVESISDYLMVRGISREIEGSIDSGYRRCCISTEDHVSFWVVERRGTRTMEPTEWDPSKWQRCQNYIEKWKTRSRSLHDENQAMQITIDLAEETAEALGPDLAAHVVLLTERMYWQARNRAAQIQKGRQDRLGMGWANHDHHTFRSSRERFSLLVRLFEILGFHCRERFYAGEQAGWGAQVMENSNAGFILFLDTDLDPKELDIDFAHHVLPPLNKMGTVGIWCALHGDSILRAGMHHLEAQFEFESLTSDLAKQGIGMMDPFSNFTYLKQAFTVGENWPVDPLRIEELIRQGLITADEGKRFLKEGAIGSHLENLQRKEGYKGFNKKNVSVIIKKTDPRTAHPVGK